jgi:Tol biopolymer transport system component
MSSMRRAVGLVCAVVVLVVAGCSAGGAGGSATSSSTTERDASVTSTSGRSATSAVSSTAGPGLDPEAWKSDLIVKISRDLKGGDADGAGGRTTISDDGRYVAFDSNAADMVPGDGHGSDIFVFDRQTGVMELASVASGGARAHGECALAIISATGRWVVFQSEADNLAPGDTNERSDVFLRDRQTGTTQLVSVGPDGKAVGGGNARGVSADGRHVAFCSDSAALVSGDTNNVDDVFVRDMEAGTTERVSVGAGGKQANGGSWDCTLSRDGRIVAFQSEATDLVPGDTNGVADIFVRDRERGITERVSVSDAGEEANSNSWDISVSADGRYVAFTSAATNLVPGDTSGQRNDAFVYDRQTKTVKRISVSPTGKEGNNSSGSPSLSADGRYVAFLSFARNLVSAPDTNGWCDVFVRDLETGKTQRVNLSADGAQARDGSPYVALSGDGRWVAFMSHANNLVPGDKNRTSDIFVAKAER